MEALARVIIEIIETSLLSCHKKHIHILSLVSKLCLGHLIETMS